MRFIILLFGFFVQSAFAASDVTQLLHGRVLAVDMQKSGNATKEEVLQGSDLLLVRLLPSTKIKKNELLQIKILALSTLKELTNLDSNQDGVIEHSELVHSDLALMRYIHGKSIEITPLIAAKINQVKYATSKKTDKASLEVSLTTDKGENFKVFYVEI